MKFGKGFWPSLWFVQGVLEVFLSPQSGIAWVFLAVATAYWLLKILPNVPGGVRPVVWVLTAILWIVSSLFLL
jgi:hypothetical protein